MSSRATVESRERLRLFVGLPLPADAAERLVAWQGDVLHGDPDLRVVPRENLHVTVAFLGHRPASEVERVTGVLREAADGLHGERVVLTPERYRETRSVGMVVLGDAGGRAGALAERVFEGLERLGVYERERRTWLPHVTVVRFRRAPGLRPSVPSLGAVSPSEVALYHSVLRPTGAQYVIRESVALGG